jgi:predicted lipid-binding transport protein (Tim44 family)
MISSQRLRSVIKMLAVVMAVAMPLAITVSSSVDARPGGGGGFGSRGSKTWSAPPTTRTAPNAAQPMQRSITQPGTTAPKAAPATGGLLNRPGLLGGLAAGFLGAGLLGMLFGGGLFSGLGGLSSIIGLVLQIGLIYLVVRLAMSWWKRRNAPAYANASAAPGPAPMQDQGPMANARSGFGFGLGGGSNDAPLEIKPDDYDAFERLLGEVQTAWSNEDIGKLHTLATPEMVSYFTEDLNANKERGVINKVSDIKLLQGDLAEAWREGPTDYATVALRYGLIDKTVERASGKIVEGSDTPEEVTDVWTFVRRPGSQWELSAIQMT